MSNDLRRFRGVSDDLATAVPPEVPVSPPTASANRVPRTRTGAAWFGICATALLSVILIVFMVQNTRSVRVDFLWMDGSLPLALALLVAATGAALLTMAVGAARITQLRRLSRQRH
ncbi:lipopolysaccharide assembly protein LapA domain-containing protein [Phytohabitans sp. LJ34]|uniref:lipopolysaccharide assembly protein LapA domain-containing protein n=1 Tax=Phytohabitans sp. LJ34 TaxID=3452217 RepID=UPI003F8BE5C7